MGNDGGSIPKRRELVKEAARNPTAAQIKETQNEQQEYYWSTDPISRKPLERPIVADSNGRLYNKDTILEYLLSASDPESAQADAEKILQGAVKSLKDVVELTFSVQDDAPIKNGASTKEVWLCPVTNEPLGPSSKAAYLVPCGHVFSGAALKEVASDKCVVCETSYAPNDAISILPTAKEEIARLLLRSKTLRDSGLTHSLKKLGKDKKKKKREREEAVEDSESTAPAAKKVNDESARINNSSTKALTEKVLREQEQRKKAAMKNENLKSLFSSRDQSKPIGKSSDFMTRGFEIPASAKR
ncbi:hypothetical protein ANO11243_089940 [Dothideomycetidae sp. 11243]|nr:hypothetical protein ANO11243_089940 [fungal sp. No.11243]